MKSRGLIHIYHGDGKGKTTAAMGLALRAAGNGLQVVIVQFLKGTSSGEIQLMREIPEITVLRENNNPKFSFQMSEEEKREARLVHADNLAAAEKLVAAGKCDLLILDEALGALSSGLLDEGLVQRLVEEKPPALELVLTGRNPSEFLLEKADYVTEMKAQKHPYEQGIDARKGIEF